MKKTVLMLILAVLFSFSMAAQEKVDMEKEKAAIKACAMDYLEGWYEGNPERMKKAMHPELLKRAPMKHPSGQVILQAASKSNMVAYTAIGFGKKNGEANKKKITFEILDVYKTIATVKTTTPEFVDYIHMAKIEGQWKMLNVLWLPVK